MTDPSSGAQRSASDPGPAAERRDAGIEAWLRSFGLTEAQVRWQPGTPLAAFDLSTSVRNQARLEGKLDKEYVAALARSLVDGAKLPPLIAYRGRNGLVVIDGNHRLRAALDVGETVFDVYLIETDDLNLLELMTRTCNAATGGKPISREHVYEQALVLLDAGHSLTEVAQRLRLNDSTLRDHKRERVAARRLKDIGVQGWDGIKPSTAAVLAPLQSDEVLRSAAELVVKAGLTHTAASELVERLKVAGSEANALAIVRAEREAYRSKLQDAAGGRSTEPKALRIERWLRSIEKTLRAGEDPDDLGYRHPDDVVRARSLAHDVQRLLSVVLGEAERRFRRAQPPDQQRIVS
ncbi:MAG TPA: ParB N-terminal domain-containing protein [Actinomycetes bacterium]|nr:ParB N-terminal domain-containing protein [Actinomycetes bacterium]